MDSLPSLFPKEKKKHINLSGSFPLLRKRHYLDISSLGGERRTKVDMRCAERPKMIVAPPFFKPVFIHSALWYIVIIVNTRISETEGRAFP